MFLNKARHTDIANCAIPVEQEEVLRDICEFLEIQHSVQQVLSGERTPTLCEVLPLYEDLLVMLRDLQSIKLAEKKGKLAAALKVTTMKIEEYIMKSRRCRIYALAMSKCIALFCILLH